MTGNKINSNPSFDTDGASEEVIPTEEPIVENEAEEQAPKIEEDENDNSTEEPSGGENENLDNGEDEKKRALAGLLAEEEKLRTQDTELDTEIAKVKERIKDRRTSRREKREIIQKADTVVPSDEVDNLSDIDETTLQILERFTKAKGLVPKAELEQIKYRDAHKTAESDFFTSHPEYLPENDSNDELYNAIKAELVTYVQPSDAKLIPKLFERAHKAVLEQFPSKFTSKSNPAAEAARAHKKTVAQMGGGQAGGSNKKESTNKTSFNERQIEILRNGGWSEEEIKSFNS